MTAMSRNKGGRAEREVLELLRPYWPAVHRNFQSGGQGGGDVTNGPPGVHLEIKHRERCAIWDWINQASDESGRDIPVVAFRRNRSKWWAAIELDELIALLRLRDA